MEAEIGKLGHLLTAVSEVVGSGDGCSVVLLWVRVRM